MSQTDDGKAHIDRMRAARAAQSADVKLILAKRTTGESTQIESDKRRPEKILMEAKTTGTLLMFHSSLHDTSSLMVHTTCPRARQKRREGGISAVEALRRQIN